MLRMVFGSARVTFMEFTGFVQLIGLLASVLLLVWHQQHNFNTLRSEIKSGDNRLWDELREMRLENEAAHREARQETDSAFREMREETDSAFREMREENEVAHREAREERRKLWDVLLDLAQRLARIEGHLGIGSATKVDPAPDTNPS